MFLSDMRKKTICSSLHVGITDADATENDTVDVIFFQKATIKT